MLNESPRQENTGKQPPHCWDLAVISKWFQEEKMLRKSLILKASFTNALLIQVVPGFDIHPHLEAYDAIFYIIRGRGFIQVGEESINVSPEMLVFSPKEKLRGIHASEDLLILGLQEPH